MQKYILPFFIFIVLVFFLGIPLSSPGALFVLDFVPFPFTQWQDWYATTLQWHIVDICKYLFGSAITSKLYFFGVYLVGIFCGFLSGKILGNIMHADTSQIRILQMWSILFVLCNPWTYERMITQPGIAMGMFCLWICLCYLLENISQTRKYSLLKASIAAAFGFLLFPHASVMLVLIALLFSIFYFPKIEKKYFLIAPLVILLLNANWLIGDIFYKQDLGTTSIASFDRANIEGFVGNSLSGLGTEVTHLLLYGFWGERFHILTPETFNHYWYIFWFLALWAILYGNILLYKKDKKLWAFLSILTLLSYILALGIASKIFGPLNNALYEYIPGYIGMREPQKWLGITMLCYGFFFLVALHIFSQKLKYLPAWLLIAIVFTLLNTWNPMNLWAYQGQLLGMTLPWEYREARDWLLEHKKTQWNILILPWHSYMSCDWTRGKIIASSQKQIFYPLSVIVSDNIEIATKYSNSTSPVSKDVESYLESKDISYLKKQNIDTLLFINNCASESKFGYLKTDTQNYKNIFQNKHIDIYSLSYEKK